MSGWQRGKMEVEQKQSAQRAPNDLASISLICQGRAERNISVVAFGVKVLFEEAGCTCPATHCANDSQEAQGLWGGRGDKDATDRKENARASFVSPTAYLEMRA